MRLTQGGVRGRVRAMRTRETFKNFPMVYLWCIFVRGNRGILGEAVKPAGAQKTPKTFGKSRVFGGLKMVARLGFEPRLTDPESAVLPLHHRAVSEDAGEYSGGWEDVKRFRRGGKPRKNPRGGAEGGRPVGRPARRRRRGRTQQVASLPRGDGRLAGEGGNGDKSGFHGVELFRNLTSMAWKNGTIRVPWRGKTANLTSMAWNFSKTTTPGAGGKEVRGE